ncbi:hypothetical protein [Campylobacter sp. US33a]|uniref:Periplasmic protein n=1 Tax=Campylobacter sp. CCS1377 TaxID=3158229 RepID=A0AAU7E8E1_9BACT|nr:hypothetical protein [Campylobacter sp. US33a]TEY02706.1 hypothetical protein ELQ16_04840 [Campylobacter sp. US33a]
MKDKSLEELNFVKLVAYVLSFIALCSLLIVLLLLPALKDYKMANYKLNNQQKLNDNFLAKLQVSKQRVEILKEENNFTLNQFNTAFNQQDFIEFLKNYFQDVRLKKAHGVEREAYLVEELNVSSTIDNPQMLNKFFKDLNQYKNVAKISYPIILNASGNKIDVEFLVKIYSTQK